MKTKVIIIAFFIVLWSVLVFQSVYPRSDGQCGVVKQELASIGQSINLANKHHKNADNLFSTQNKILNDYRIHCKGER